ncbi:MAG: hypothetical protein UZ17_ACD001001990 [Acidobacteria bacterium OLB17]|nr:MAG: hypothetical protein UZ17_ACD001001990 [Acidobacteria bacterium OLB17]MCZ2390131.1 hypothetical protein [Acidobacteriota bacterium]
MISGFNTDVEHNGVVYHIQTEDKGLSSQLIVSLVYDRGTILASKRTPYNDLNVGSLDEAALSDRLSRQHKLICAAVKAGRISDLQQMTGKARAAKRDAAAAPTELHEAEAQPTVTVPEETVAAAVVPTAPIETQRIITVSAPEAPAIEIPTTQPPAATVELDDEFFDLPVFEDAVMILDEIQLLPDEAVEIASELSGIERPRNEKLSVDILGETKFKGGDRLSLNILVCRGTDRRVVKDAQLMVKVLGSAFRPVIFHAKSDANGLAKVHLQIPHFQAGRAAMLVKVIADGEELETRRLVTPG